MPENYNPMHESPHPRAEETDPICNNVLCLKQSNEYISGCAKSYPAEKCASYQRFNNAPCVYMATDKKDYSYLFEKKPIYELIKNKFINGGVYAFLGKNFHGQTFVDGVWKMRLVRAGDYSENN